MEVNSQESAQELALIQKALEISDRNPFAPYEMVAVAFPSEDDNGMLRCEIQDLTTIL